MRVEGDGPVREVIDGGGSVIAFLGHLGNWDLAGAWGTTHLGPVTTVAERLKPEEVFEEFLAFRESLGMTIIPLTGGGERLPGAARGRSRGRASSRCSPTATSPPRGVEVELLRPRRPDGARAGRAGAGRRSGRCTRSRSATSAAAAGLGHRHHLPPGGRRARDAAPPASGATAMTQACADVLGAAIIEHTSDWHMLQRVFVDDLDQDRLRRVPHAARRAEGAR